MIKILIPSQILTFLKTFTQPIIQSMEGELMISVELPQEDKDLEDAWRESLLEQLQEDIQDLIHFLEDAQLKDGQLSLLHGTAESVLRGVSAIRIKIHQVMLQDIPDTSLESGNVNPKLLSHSTHNGYILFVLLAQIQELIIAKL